MDHDRIERTMTLDVPRADVWAAITEPDQISKWFGTDTELELRAGAKGVFRWDTTEVQFVVEEVDPPRRFSYRWEPSELQTGGPTTLVEFTLEETSGGTLLTLVETGFAALPEQSRLENEKGWDEELGSLRDYLTKARA
ncbi:MAG TPA: SRPBCC family protein [Gaiellaceae bacterium]|nr:SRPBCC family protein [Gaiellaceae bacterium]